MYCRTAVCQAGPGLELLLLVERGRQAALLAELGWAACPAVQDWLEREESWRVRAGRVRARDPATLLAMARLGETDNA